MLVNKCKIQFSLIPGSIISKKAAENPRALILDVKVGKGAVMKKMEDAKKLAVDLVSIHPKDFNSQYSTLGTFSISGKSQQWAGYQNKSGPEQDGQPIGLCHWECLGNY